MKKKLYIAAAALLAAFCLCSAAIVAFVALTSPEPAVLALTAAPVLTRTALAAPTRAPTATREPTGTPSSEPTQRVIERPTQSPPTVEPTSKGLGLLAGDITVYLEDRLGFDCSGISDQGGALSWSCSNSGAGITLFVEMSGHSVTIEFIEASAIQEKPDVELTTLFLIRMADLVLPEAEDWVRANAPGGAEVETVIAGIPLRLSGPPSFRTIEIGVLP